MCDYLTGMAENWKAGQPFLSRSVRMAISLQPMRTNFGAATVADDTMTVLPSIVASAAEKLLPSADSSNQGGALPSAVSRPWSIAPKSTTTLPPFAVALLNAAAFKYPL
jgi:hypothetical protein